MAKLKQFPKDAIERNTKLYDEYINEFDMPNGWLSGNQKYNFKALSRIAEMAGIPFNGKSVLDVGCGSGDLLTFLKNAKLSRYVGIDIYKPSLEQARKNHPTTTFIEGDILSDIIQEKFGYVLCSGALTVKLAADNYEFLEAMLAKMWELSEIGITFNVLTNDDPEQDPDLFFYDPIRVLQICHDIAPDAVVGAEETPDVAQIHVYMYREDKTSPEFQSKT